jgi:predicted PurR-regulated permease PerM
MDSPRQVRILNWGRWAGTAAAILVAFYLVYQLQEILLLFYLAAIIGLAINPLILWLERHRFSRKIAVGLMAVLFLGCTVAALFWIIPPALDQAQKLIGNLPDYYNHAEDWVRSFTRQYPELQSRLTAGSLDLKGAVANGGNLLLKMGTWAFDIGRVLVSLFLIFFLVVFGLLDPTPMARALFEMTPPDAHDRLERALSAVQEKIVSWAGGTLILMATVGAMAGIGLYFLHIPQALLFAIIAALGEGIPNIGPVISAVPPILATLLVDPPKALWVAALYVVIQQAENHLIVPFVMGARLNVHPWGLIFMILVMGKLFGVAGLFLATPTAAILGVLYAEFFPKPGRGDSLPIIQRIVRVIGGMNGQPYDPC